jgi:hypothetical protein
MVVISQNIRRLKKQPLQFLFLAVARKENPHFVNSMQNWVLMKAVSAMVLHSDYLLFESHAWQEYL